MRAAKKQGPYVQYPFLIVVILPSKHHLVDIALDLFFLCDAMFSFLTPMF